MTEYVREEFNRAEALQNDKNAGTIGFALTILQRRLASSPEAIYQSLHRRKERLESRLRELQLLQRGSQFTASLSAGSPQWSEEDITDLDEAPGEELAMAEEQVLDHATAARTVGELEVEIKSLRRLESLARTVRASGEDKKWQELADLLNRLFTNAGKVIEESFAPSPHQKLVIFTEHRDTLNYLCQRIITLFGRQESIVMIHGGIGREERRTIQESFLHDPQVQILLANDAASEGINLQRAHLMVNYDLPWNPNRIEQRFGRIHRIGQTEVCHLWNLIAEETREGDVYHTLLEKLEEARKALGGQVFDVLGQVQFEGKPLRELLLEAIRYGERPDVQARLTKAVSDAFDKTRVQDLLSGSALVQDSMDTSRVLEIRDEMERAEVRKLQPHYIESFFIEAFRRLGGGVKERSPDAIKSLMYQQRCEIVTGGSAWVNRYCRDMNASPLRKFSCLFPVDPQRHSLPRAPAVGCTIDLTLERHRGLLRQSSALVDENDASDKPRVLMYLEHSIEDGRHERSGKQRTISRKVLYVEVNADSTILRQDYAPYLDYRPLSKGEPSVETIVNRPECSWINGDLEAKAVEFAVSQLVPDHLEEVRSRKTELLSKTEGAVKERLTKEIAYWDHRAADLQLQEQAGKPMRDSIPEKPGEGPMTCKHACRNAWTRFNASVRCRHCPCCVGWCTGGASWTPAQDDRRDQRPSGKSRYPGRCGQGQGCGHGNRAWTGIRAGGSRVG